MNQVTPEAFECAPIFSPEDPPDSGAPWLSGRPSMLLSLLAPLALSSSVPAPVFQEGDPAPQDGTATDSASSPAGSSFDLEATVVTATTEADSAFHVPYTVHTIQESRIDQLRTFPQTLRDVPGVMVQETGAAQGSPFIRGFTGFRTLTLVDGIRLNNSTFRSGPNQYMGTIDPLGIERVEVVKGPSSVLYGSDAIGGTVQVFTKDPMIWDREIGGELFTRFATAENYNIQRLELGGALSSDTAWRVGGSRKDFGDVEQGGGTVLENTGYDEWDADAKVQHLVDDETTLTFAYQRVDIDDAPRTHRTVFAVPFAGSEVGTDLVRDLDQVRELSYVRLNTDAAEADGWTTESTLSYHRQEETRFRERTGDRIERRGFDVQTLGLTSRAARETGLGRLRVGFEYYRDSVDSFTNRFDDQTAADDIQGPLADDATYDLGGLYGELEFDVTGNTTVTAGVRGTYARADANEVRNTDTDQQFSLDEDFTAVTGSVRFETRIVDERDNAVSLFGGISQGFRAPSLSDLTRLDGARSNQFESPSPGLDPEDFISYELGLKHRTNDLSFQLAGFLTQGDDLINRIVTGVQNADGEDEVAKENIGETLIGGVELGVAYRLDDAWTAFGNLTWLDGQQETREIVGGPIVESVPSRLMPLTYQAGLRFEPAADSFAIEARWIHADDADRLAPNDENDDTRIPPGGTPGYDVFDVMGSFPLSDGTRLLLGVENITDENYRIHGSGLNRPGRNFVFGASWTF